MNYIVHKRFKQTGASGERYNFPYGTELETIGNFIAYNNEAVCTTTSQQAHEYFARNDDGRGLERGKLTYAIAFSSRHPNKTDTFRFTPEQRNLLIEKYSHFLIPSEEWILFNHNFFNAEVEELEEMAQQLEVI